MTTFIDTPLALAAGMLTVASPCVLPLLPILLGSAVERAGRLRPLFIVLGFVAAFSGLGIALSLLSGAVESAHEAVRSVSVAALALFGLARIWPRPYDWLAARLSGPLQGVIGLGDKGGSGNAGGFLLGMSLGAVWTPCAGPVLASILILAARADNLAHSSLLLLVYGLGAGIPMLAIAYGGGFAARRVGAIARHAVRLQRAFGVLLVASAIAIHFQYDVLAYAWISRLFS
ncbi:cytochrome c biogenesis CcdA family protein [Achromobacter insuavis]|uniref:cytochrome c biogenesis CcdA family protein n=1 Tax=Achromobacter insuavis TaxID=1287735 RepID=UPI001F146891|nr:cytochrome c biogenesis CcdA family protein [Achromobacter insuavis]